MIPGIQVSAIDSTSWTTILEIQNTYGRLKSINVSLGPPTGDNKNRHFVKIEIDDEVVISEMLQGSLPIDLPFENHLKIETRQDYRSSLSRIWISYAIGESPTMKIEGADIEIVGLTNNLRALIKHTQEIQKAQRRIESTQEDIGELPDTLSEALSETVRNVIEEEFDNITELIESDDISEEKKNELVRTVSVGIERGLPTALVEVSGKSTDE